MMEFDLQGHEYIALNNLMKLLNFAQSGGEANQIIDSGAVIVNSVVEYQKRKKLRAGDKVLFKDKSVIII